MANKRRPKKTKAPYRRYGPGNAVKHTHGHTSGSEDDEDEEDEVEMNGFVQGGFPVSAPKTKNSSHVSISPCAYGYATTTAATATIINKTDDTNKLLNRPALPTWPISKFQKIDVLSYAILSEKIKSGEIVEIPIHFTEEDEDEYEDDDDQSFLEGSVFPAEIYDLILNYVNKKDPKYLRVSKLWYRIYVRKLYHTPQLDTHNFLKFVDTITTPKNRIGANVRSLDLSTIIQSGKNSYVSKVLRRCADNLEIFVAPQSSFGYAPLISLRGCTKIKVLDLGYVSETVNLKELFHSISNANDLTTLSFPRSSISCEECDDHTVWPPTLSSLRLSGGINDKFLSESIFPSTIKRLEFAHCPLLTESGIYSMLTKCGENITHLSIQYPMPKLKENSLDFIFTYCPNLVFVQITVDYCSRSLFTEELLPKLNHGRSRSLRTIWIESSGGLGVSSKIHPDDLTIAIMEDRLPLLKNVRITSKLGWHIEGDDVGDLVNLLEEKDGGLYLNHR